MPYRAAFHPSLALMREPRNASMSLLSLAAWQQPRGEVGEAAFPGKQWIGSKWQKHLGQAELSVVMPEVE